MVVAIVAFLALTVTLYSKAVPEADSLEAADTISLSGQVFNELGKPIAKGVLRVNGRKAGAIENGRFQVAAPTSPVLQLNFQSPGHYSMIHSFSIQELQENKGVVADVTLVTRKAGRTLFAFGGDVMAGRRYYKPLHGDRALLTPDNENTATRQLLAHVKPYLQNADIASVNLEIVIAEHKPAVETPKSITFYARPALVEALKWAGVDYVSLGNNHVYDFGDEGVVLTQKYLSAHNLPSSGGGLNERQALMAYPMVHGGNTYRLLGYVGWKGNFTPNQVAESDKGGAAWGSAANIADSVTRESTSGDAVIVQYHGGREYHYNPTEQQTSRMRLAIDSGSDLVVSHHPHVLQGFELYRDKLIAYSLGNFLFDQYFQDTHRSALLYVWMDSEQFVRAEIVPLYVKHYQTTPAVGAVRQHVLRRAKHQSWLAGTGLSASGGHGVIEAGVADKKPVLKITDQVAHRPVLEKGHWSGRLPMTWQRELLSVTSDDKQATCRTGRDLLVTGDFESDHGLVEQPGTWRLSSDSAITRAAGRSGSHAMMLAPGKTEAVTRGFHRFVEARPDTMHSLLGHIRSGASQQLEVCLEYAPRSKPFSKSLQAAELECFGTVTTGEGGWEAFRVDFPPLDKEKIKGYRLRLQAAGALSSPVYLDDLSWVAWNPPVACTEIKAGVENIDVLSVNASRAVQISTGK